jgi:lysine 6-dehydrogenase
MSYAYAVVGAGRQGIAAAYDLVMLGDASRLLFVDANEDVAQSAAATINRLSARAIATAARADARDAGRLQGQRLQCHHAE